MGIKIMAEVLDLAQTTQGETLFLLALADRAADDTRIAWPGSRELIRRTRSSRASVYRYAANLSARGYIEQVSDEEIQEQGLRYLGHQGHRTVTWRIRPKECWETAGQTVEGSQIETPEELMDVESRDLTSETVGVSLVRREPTGTTTSSRKTRTATQSSSSRSAARSRKQSKPAGFADPVDDVFAAEQEDDDEEPPATTVRGSVDSAYGLTAYFKLHASVGSRLGDVNEGALRKFFASAKRQGVTPDTLRAMVDCFVTDTRFMREKNNRWKLFIANARLLQERAHYAAQDDSKPMAAFEGAIPQDVLDRVLAGAL